MRKLRIKLIMKYTSIINYKPFNGHFGQFTRIRINSWSWNFRVVGGRLEAWVCIRARAQAGWYRWVMMRWFGSHKYTCTGCRGRASSWTQGSILTSSTRVPTTYHQKETSPLYKSITNATVVDNMNFICLCRRLEQKEKNNKNTPQQWKESKHSTSHDEMVFLKQKGKRLSVSWELSMV